MWAKHMNDSPNITPSRNATTDALSTVALPECFGTGYYEVKLAGYRGAYRRYRRSAGQCFGCNLKAECFETRHLLAVERRGR
jgi:hypothetical protein